MAEQIGRPTLPICCRNLWPRKRTRTIFFLSSRETLMSEARGIPLDSVRSSQEEPELVSGGKTSKKRK